MFSYLWYPYCMMCKLLGIRFVRNCIILFMQHSAAPWSKGFSLLVYQSDNNAVDYGLFGFAFTHIAFLALFAYHCVCNTMAFFPSFILAQQGSIGKAAVLLIGLWLLDMVLLFRISPLICFNNGTARLRQPMMIFSDRSPAIRLEPFNSHFLGPKYQNFESCLLSVWVLFNPGKIGKDLIQRF